MEEKLRFVFEYERDERVDDGAVRAVRNLRARPGMCGCGDTGSTGSRGWWN